LEFLEHEQEDNTVLEPINEGAVDDEPTPFNEYLLGANLLQGSAVEVFFIKLKN